MSLLRLTLLSAVCLLIISCGSQRKVPVNYNYLQAVGDSSSKNLSREVVAAEYIIQKHDLLYIRVSSDATKPEIDQLYNLQDANNTNSSVSGFLVGNDGNITYPRLGTIKAEGLTKQQLALSMQNKLLEKKELTNPVVVIRILNYHISVQGEVKQEGVFNIPNERVTILEALAMAGGITVDGKKTTVKVLREVNGKREVGVVDVTTAGLFDSPFYNLMQNDVVIVEMTKRKARQQDQQNTIQKASFFVGVVTALVLVYNTFNRN